MLALKKTQQMERDNLLQQLRDKQDELEDAISEANADLEGLRNKVAEAQDNYNEALSELREFRDQLVADWRDQFAEKSEDWRNGARGEEVNNWIGSWEEVDLDDISIDWPDEFEPPDLDTTSAMEDLQDEPEDEPEEG